MTRETCATCRFFDAHEAPWTSGACRAHAPRAVMFDDQDETALTPRWPSVCGEFDWCGEHQPVAPAPAASDDYTRAGMAVAEADARYRQAVIEAPHDLVPGALEDDLDTAGLAFLRLCRERHDAP